MITLKKDVWLYIALLFLATYAVQIFVVLQGGEEYSLFPIFIGLSMFFPGLGAIIYLIQTKQGLQYIDWKLGNPLYILLSLLLPPIITLIGIFIFEKIGLGTNYAYYIPNNMVKDIEIPLLLGTEPQSIPFFILNFLVTGIVFSLITSLLTVGEEIGWRGFLQKKLLEQNSLLKSLIFLGLLWGFWHCPLVLNGLNYPEYPVWGAFLIFPLVTVFVSFFLGLLSINSKSIWPAVFAHGGINSVMIFLFEMDFGANKFVANFAILGMWVIIGILSFMLVSKDSVSKNI